MDKRQQLAASLAWEAMNRILYPFNSGALQI